MYKAKLTSKGQITLPAAVRDALGLQPGEKVVFLPGANGEFRVRRVGSIKDLYGCVQYSGPPITSEAIKEAIAEHLLELDEATKSDARQEIPDGAAA
jgi:AbrB family looped-hinge helix DNA binding protein